MPTLRSISDPAAAPYSNACRNSLVEAEVFKRLYDVVCQTMPVCRSTPNVAAPGALQFAKLCSGAPR